jgi:protein TonB
MVSADRAMVSKPIPNPTGSVSRTELAAKSEPIPAAILKPEPAAATPPPPAAAESIAPVAAPLRIERPHRPAAVATVTVEPVTGSKIGRIVGRIPGFNRRRKDFVPARPIRQVTPAVPANEHLVRDTPVDLRITVDPAGNVMDVEQASRGADRQLVRVASDAARGWQFVPARRNDESVTSELILHFTFPGSRPMEP